MKLHYQILLKCPPPNLTGWMRPCIQWRERLKVYFGFCCGKGWSIHCAKARRM